MPYQSQRQRRYMHAKHPEIAKRWDAKYGTKIVKNGAGRKRSNSRSR